MPAPKRIASRSAEPGAIPSDGLKDQRHEGDVMTHGTMDPAPATVILVHGAFADASGWQGVIERLQAHGVPVVAPANPLRGIAHDSAYLASLLDGIPGPIIAVGHSYGGAVITNAAT